MFRVDYEGQEFPKREKATFGMLLKAGGGKPGCKWNDVSFKPDCPMLQLSVDDCDAYPTASYK